MSAQPVREDDPRDPQVILALLPEREHQIFLDGYHAKVDAAHDPAGYRQLQSFLQAWSLRARVVSRPGHYEDIEAEIAAIKDGTARGVPFFEAIDAELARRGQ